MRTARSRTGHLSQPAGAERRSGGTSEAARRRVERSRRLLLARVVIAALALLGVLMPSRAAHAVGSVTITDRAPQENDGRWKLKMTINYGSTPHLAHIPMLFSFTPLVHYERALTDQSPDKPVLNRIPLHNQQSINESMDVGFSDGSGKIFKMTKFDFVLRRDRGFEAGEYELKITRLSDGAQVGQKQRITLQGENPVVDRRAIVFTGDKKKKAGEEKAGADGAEKKDETAEAQGEAEAEAAPAEEPAVDDEGAIPTEAPPPVEPRQGGCGCRLGPEDTAPIGAPLAALAALAAFAGRQRARRSARRAPDGTAPRGA